MLVVLEKLMIKKNLARIKIEILHIFVDFIAYVFHNIVINSNYMYLCIVIYLFDNMNQIWFHENKQSTVLV